MNQTQTNLVPHGTNIAPVPTHPTVSVPVTYKLQRSAVSQQRKKPAPLALEKEIGTEVALVRNPRPELPKTNMLAFSFRVVVLVLSMFFGTMMLVGNARNAHAATLHSHATLTSGVLTLGDVFAGVPAERADYVLGPAPLPGKDMVLNANTLLRVAMALDIKWRPQSVADQITIRTAATIIDSKQITEQLKERLQDEMINEDFEIVFGSHEPQIILPHNKPASMEIVALDFDPRSDWFEAEVAAPSADKPLTRMTISGKIERLMDIPVLRTTLREGDIIQAGDIEWLQIRSREQQHNFVVDADKVAGMSPRRLVRAGQPIRSNELVEPQLVGRGDHVTLVYEEGPITLTTQGRALRDGARGETIRVVNTASNRSVDAIVKDEGLVVVATN
jgi:flagella basal body P-ring formation protein FlgA